MSAEIATLRAALEEARRHLGFSEATLLRLLYRAKEALLAYEAFEADLILHGDWSGEGVRMNQAQHDKMMECEALRNAALAAIKQAEGK